MSTTTDIVDNTTDSSVFTFTVHLPGLKKTVKMSYDKTPVNPMELFHFITNSFGIVSRRASLFLIPSDGYPVQVNEFSLAFNGLRIVDGDTLIICVRATTVSGENEYYETQMESLKKNKYLDPPIPKVSALSLLVDIVGNFEMYGHKHYMPGGRWYEYKKILNGEISLFYCKKDDKDEMEPL
jgi:hypothetical protein